MRKVEMQNTIISLLERVDTLETQVKALASKPAPKEKKKPEPKEKKK